MIECEPCNGIPFVVARLHRDVGAWPRRAQLDLNIKNQND